MEHAMTFGDEITLDEFQRETGISSNNYIFLGVKHPRFWKMELQYRPTEYFYDNGNGRIREFKYMKEYGEWWIRIFDKTVEKPCWSLWNTWRVCD